MEKWRIAIATTADGQESSVRREGEFERNENGVRLQYRENGAIVTISIDRAGISIVREGDYALRLRLEKDKLCQGMLGIGGGAGEVFTQTEYLAWSIKSESVLFSARYDLIVGGEPQKMKVRLSATKE